MPDAIFALFADYAETNVGIPGRAQGFRISITLRVKTGFSDAYLFRYQQVSADEVLFTGVCSPADIADYGTAPKGDGTFFRAATATLDFADSTSALQIRNDILRQLDTLCHEMARLANNMSPTQTIEISSAPGTSTDLDQT